MNMNEKMLTIFHGPRFFYAWTIFQEEEGTFEISKKVYSWFMVGPATLKINSSKSNTNFEPKLEKPQPNLIKFLGSLLGTLGELNFV